MGAVELAVPMAAAVSNTVSVNYDQFGFSEEEENSTYRDSPVQTGERLAVPRNRVLVPLARDHTHLEVSGQAVFQLPSSFTVVLEMLA